jgi:hypothetical protein
MNVLSDDYLVHQARQFHKYAQENLTGAEPTGAAVTYLAISVEYLIELEEKRINERVPDGTPVPD